MSTIGPAARLAEALMSYAQDLTTSGGHYQAARAAARALLARLEEIEPALKADSLCTCGHASDAHLLPSQQMYCAVDNCPCMHYKEERCEGSGAGFGTSTPTGGSSSSASSAPSPSPSSTTEDRAAPSASEAATFPADLPAIVRRVVGAADVLPGLRPEVEAIALVCCEEAVKAGMERCALIAEESRCQDRACTHDACLAASDIAATIRRGPEKGTT